jgi:hypothetical protein
MTGMIFKLIWVNEFKIQYSKNNPNLYLNKKLEDEEIDNEELLDEEQVENQEEISEGVDENAEFYNVNDLTVANPDFYDEPENVEEVANDKRLKIISTQRPTKNGQLGRRLCYDGYCCRRLSRSYNRKDNLEMSRKSTHCTLMQSTSIYNNKFRKRHQSERTRAHSWTGQGTRSQIRSGNSC